MLKILWKRGKIAPEEQFLLLSTIFYYLMLDFYVKTRIRFSLRDKRLFEITEVEITRIDCICTTKAKAVDIALYHIRDQSEKQFVIYSDFLSVLKSLNSLDLRNPLIQQILRKYNYLLAFKEIVFLLAS